MRLRVRIVSLTAVAAIAAGVAACTPATGGDSPQPVAEQTVTVGTHPPAALTRPAKTSVGKPGSPDAGHHGTRDARQAARGQSERDHARQGSGKSRSYAFRRS